MINKIRIVIKETIHNETNKIINNNQNIKDPKDINKSYCVNLAYEVSKEFEVTRYSSNRVFLDDFVKRYPMHTWIVYNGLNYDSEIPEGTENWHNLPIFQRGPKINKKHVIKKYRR